jgi:hypothetical protein
MSHVAKFFLMGLSSVALLLATASDSEAGCRHRHRRGGCGHHGGYSQSACYSAPVQSSCCDSGYGGGYAVSAPVSNGGCCTTGGSYGGQAYGGQSYSQGYSQGQHSPQMAPSGQSSPSDTPAGSPPPPPPAQ